MHLISARAERAYSRSILKRLKMSQTRSSANTFQIHMKNISSDNTHLCFSSRRAHKIEEEIQIYSQLCVFTFASAQKRKSCFFARDAETFLVLLKNISSDNISASHRTEHIQLKKKYRYALNRACSLLRVHRRGTVVFLLNFSSKTLKHRLS